MLSPCYWKKLDAEYTNLEQNKCRAHVWGSICLGVIVFVAVMFLEKWEVIYHRFWSCVWMSAVSLGHPHTSSFRSSGFQMLWGLARWPFSHLQWPHVRVQVIWSGICSCSIFSQVWLWTADTGSSRRVLSINRIWVLLDNMYLFPSLGIFCKKQLYWCIINMQ